MEQKNYHPNHYFGAFKIISLFFALFFFSAVSLYGQNKSATVNVHVNCQSLGAKDLQVIGIGKGYSVMQTTNSSGDVTFNVTWSGPNTETFYFYVNAAYGDFNGPNNTAVAIVTVTNNGTESIQFVLNANSERSYSISGRVYNESVGQTGVMVRLFRSEPTAYNTWVKIDSVMTDANGDYTFASVVAIGIYKTEAYKSGFQYAPDPYNYNNLTGSLTNQNFTSIQAGITRSISGYVYKYGTTTPIANALVTLYRGNSTNIADIYSTALTNPDGSYSFLVFDGSSYTMVPSMDGYTFAAPAGPPLVYYPSITGDVTQNFYGQLLTYSLSGTVLYNGNPLQYTMVKLYQLVGGNKVQPAIDSIVTGGAGTYTFTNVPGRSDYAIEPSGVGTATAPNTPLAGYNFNPVTRSLYFLIGNQTGLDFSASKNTIRISGYLLDPLKTPQGVQNIVVNISGAATQQYSTNAAGYYEFYVPARSNYTITPASALTGYLFSPGSWNISADTLLGNEDNQNFRADIQSYTISGIVYNDAVAMNVVLLTLTGTNNYGATVNQTYTTGTGAAGAYTFTVGALGSYTITPSYSGSDFSPPSRTFASVVQNQTQNFTTTTNTKRIFGYVRRDVNNDATGLNDIPLTFVSGSGSGALSFSTVTQSFDGKNGYYTVYLPANETYRITPQDVPDMGYRFTYPGTGNIYHDVGPLTLNENGPYIFNADTARYNITITVTGSGTEMTAVTIVGGTGGDAVNLTQNLANGGSYVFTNLLGLTNYTVTPYSALYNFDPPERQFPQLIGNKSQTFIVDVSNDPIKNYKIKGTITKPDNTTGLQNVVVTITGGSSPGIVATDVNGYYEYSTDAGNTYTVTPSLEGYDFRFKLSGSTTNDSLVVNLRADSIVNFSTTYKKSTISGKVFHNGAELSGVIFKLYKRALSTDPWTEVIVYGAGSVPTSDATGNYSFTILDQRHDYRVVPQPGTYTFIPVEKVFTNLLGDKPNEDFATASNTFTLSGRISTSSDRGVGNVSVNLISTTVGFNFASATQTVDTTGNYSFTVPAGYSYRITPVTIPDMGYTFVKNPGGGASWDVGPVSSVYINLNFRADTNSYTVSGAISGVTAGDTTLVITTAPGFSETKTVVGNNPFTFTLKGLIDYEMVPYSPIYNFTPSSRILANLVGSKTGQDFAATSSNKTYKISGYITRQDPGHVDEGVINLIVELNNGTTVTTTTNTSGYYEFTVPAGSTYTITPLMPPSVPDHGYTFDPVFRTISTPVSADIPNQNFTANLNKYTISGTVWNNGVKMNGVVVRLFDGTTNSDYTTGTANAGEYTFANLDAHKNYTVTPLTNTGAGVGYTFLPITKTFTDLVGNKNNEDFATNSNTYKISGYVARNLANLTTGVNNVVIALATTSGAINFSSTTVTGNDPSDANNKGYYEFVVPAGNTYSITPSVVPDQGYSYAPVVINTSSPLAANLPNQNFTANLNNYTISGKVWNSGSPMSGVLLTLKKNNVVAATVTTGVDGLYSFLSLEAHADYIVTPEKAGFTFLPQARTFLDLVGDKPGEDFVTSENTHKISGYVRRTSNAGVPNITLNLVNAVGPVNTNISAVSQPDGYYEFTVPAGVSYKITPLTVPDQGYNFTPVNITTPVVVTSLTEQNFTANLNSYTISGYVLNSAGGTGLQGVTVHCTGRPDVLTNANGFYSFTVLALGTYTILPEYTGLNFAPTFATFENVIGNKTQDFITITDRGQIFAEPTFLAYGDVLVNRKVSKTLVISNNGIQPIIVANMIITGDVGSFSLATTPSFPLVLTPGGTYTLTVDFRPNSLGPKNGNLNIYHDAATANPLVVPLSGNGVATFATLDVPAVIDFGTVVLASGVKEKTIIIGNNSPFAGDYLNISSSYFETGATLFSVPTPFPIILEPGTTYPIVVKLEPNELGFKQNFIHIINSSANKPDARIEVRANIIQGDLIVVPSYIDFGRTSQGLPFKDTTVSIQNNSSVPITLQQKYITGDTASFTIDNPVPIVLQPNQTDFVGVRFYPPTAGRKIGFFIIKSNYQLAPELFVPLTGIAGDQPSISSDMMIIDFGNLRNGEKKDTTVVITNQGNLDLVITSKTFEGLNPEVFSFVTDGNPVTLRGGQSETIVLRATGKLPIGAKSANLIFASNDPVNPSFSIQLLAHVRSNVLFKSVDQIIFDTVVVGYFQDSTFVLRNDGDLTAEIGQMYLDGAYSSDFLLPGLEVPFQLQPGESKTITARFKPLATGMRYARLVINVNDPENPTQFIILKGWGKDSDPFINVEGGAGPEEEFEIDFGRVTIFETKYRTISIVNLSKWEKLRIDSIGIDPIIKQPFGQDQKTFPFFINSKDKKSVVLSFNPHDKVFAYSGYLNIFYSDSLKPSNKNTFVKVRMKGTVAFPTANVELTPVLKFGKVIKDMFKTVEFKVTNLGDTYLQIDSMLITGEDKDEFSIGTKPPVRLEFQESAMIPVTFKASKVGSKDALITIYWNDIFMNGTVEIWAECVLSNNQTVGVKSLEIPKSFDITQNYPNPFNPSTRIEYSIPEQTFVTIKLYNSIGQEVSTLVNEMHNAGVYYADFDAKALPSGVYFYRISTEKFTALKKMMLLK